jgi:predicted RNA-binding protein
MTNPIMGTMAEEKKGISREAEEAEEKLKEGLRRIFEATKELSKEVIEGFKEGYGGGKKDK